MFYLVVILILWVSTAFLSAVVAARILGVDRNTPPSKVSLLIGALTVAWGSLTLWLVDNPVKKNVRIMYASEIQREIFREEIDRDLKAPVGERVCTTELSLIPLVRRKAPTTSATVKVGICQTPKTKLMKLTLAKTLLDHEKVVYIPVTDAEIEKIQQMKLAVKSGAKSAEISKEGVTIGAIRLEEVTNPASWLVSWTFDGKPPKEIFYIRYKPEKEKNAIDTILFDLDEAEKIIEILKS